MTLHIIQSTNIDLETCLNLVSDQDGILLISDGVYFSDKILSANTYGLKSDALTRGLKTDNEQITWIDYEQFVALTAQHSPIVNWG